MWNQCVHNRDGCQNMSALCFLDVDLETDLGEQFGSSCLLLDVKQPNQRDLLGGATLLLDVEQLFHLRWKACGNIRNHLWNGCSAFGSRYMQTVDSHPEVDTGLPIPDNIHTVA